MATAHGQLHMTGNCITLSSFCECQEEAEGTRERGSGRSRVRGGRGTTEGVWGQKGGKDCSHKMRERKREEFAVCVCLLLLCSCSVLFCSFALLLRLLLEIIVVANTSMLLVAPLRSPLSSSSSPIFSWLCCICCSSHSHCQPASFRALTLIYGSCALSLSSSFHFGALVPCPLSKCATSSSPAPISSVPSPSLPLYQPHPTYHIPFPVSHVPCIPRTHACNPAVTNNNNRRRTHRYINTPATVGLG